MECKWVVENHVFDEDIKPLINEIKHQGFKVKEVSPDPFDNSNYNFFPADECVIVYGSLQLCSQLNSRPWYPGVWCTLENYRCCSYYVHWGAYLLNDEYIMLPFNELDRRFTELFDLLGQRKALFVRPDDGYKSFTGNVIYHENRNEAFSLMESSIDASLANSVIGEPKTNLVVVAPPRNILKEWRFVIAGDEIVTGSQYKENGRYSPKESYDQAAYDLVEEILKSSTWRPDPAFTMDICQTYNSYNLLEIGAFSSSGMYRSDWSKVVSKISKLALKEWSEVMGLKEVLDNLETNLKEDEAENER